MARIDHNRISELLKEAQLGNREAFSEIVRLMVKPITALTYKMTRDSDAAKDLTQDTFVSAWQNLGEFRGDSRFESWLFRIAANKSVNYLKRESKTVSDTALSSHQSDHDPEIDLQRQQLRERVFAFMSQLPAQQKVVFDLRFYKQLPFEDVARVSGKAVGTVKTLYREAVKKLRRVATREGWSI